jgi:murein DD-endopeptidase MepM/ murein hydrolase activator NlpD
MKTKNKYQLPLEKNKLFVAISDPKAHFREFQNCVDFLIKPKTKILASADGEVFDVKDNSIIGGPDSKYRALEFQNYITLIHPNKEFSQYVHLAPKSALVKKGQKIIKGQPIAKGIGMIGYTTAPHLHFGVFSNNGNPKSLEIKWKDKSPKIYSEPDKISKELKKPKYLLFLKELNTIVNKIKNK